MNNVADYQDAISRPIKTFAQINEGSRQGIFWMYNVCLIEADDFLKLLKSIRAYGDIPRRTLQLYCSPQLQLMPRPVYRGGHKSYYMNPEHTERMGVIVHLRDKLRFPLKDISRIMASFPAEHYRLIKDGTLQGDELLQFANAVKRGFGIKDFIYYRACKMIAAINGLYDKGVSKYGDEPPFAERYVSRMLMKELGDLADWLKTDRRLDMGYIGTSDETWTQVQADRKEADHLTRRYISRVRRQRQKRDQRRKAA